MRETTHYVAHLDADTIKRWYNRGRRTWVVGTGFEDPDNPPPGAPNAPRTFTAVKNPASPTSQVNCTWQAPLVDATHAVQTGYRVYADGSPVGSDLAAGATSSTVTGLAPGGTYAMTARAFNATGTSVASASANVTLDGGTAVTMLMGCSDSPNSHGGTEEWDGWRVYTSSAMLSRANRTGAERPVFLAYSKDGANLGGTNPNYTTVYNEVRADLNNFYYNNTTSTHSARWGIKLYWSNGNENSDKGALTLPHTTASTAAYTTSQRALYDAVHYVDPATSTRRYPDAYAGSNPTQNQEQNSQVEDWLHQSARYHDFVMWSMYPPGRQTTTADPTYNWPSFNEADRTNLRLGFMIRCFYRTKQAEIAARNATGDPSFRLMISCGEVGIGDSPANQNTRPYYAVHALAGGMYLLAAQYGFVMPFTCWWDNQSDAGAPQNILTDEPGGTTPSTRVAWQNWLTYDHRRGGTHPGSWTGLPGSVTKFTGTKV